MLDRPQHIGLYVDICVLHPFFANSDIFSIFFSIAAAFATIWDVKSDTLEEGDFSGMWKLTLLCGCIQLCPLILIRLLPENVEEQVINYK